MDKFSYKAWDKDFNIIKGIIEDDSIETAVEKLKEGNLKVISITKKFNILELKIFKRNIKDELLSEFCGQMGTVLESGVSIIKGLEVLKDQTLDKRMKGIIDNVLVGVKRGKTFAAALKDEGSFPVLLTDMVMSGEISGNIETVLFNMENFYQREANIKNKLKSASIYPSMILVVAIFMLMFFNFFVFSEFKSIFNDMAKLPWFTSFILNLIDFVNSNFIDIMLVFLVLLVLIKFLMSIKKIRYLWDFFVLRIPITGQVKKNMIISRFTRSMEIFLKSAVPILSVMDNMKLTLENRYASKKIEQIKNEIMVGSSIADAMEREVLFDPLVVQMIRVGEETGRLEDMFFKLANIYDKKVETGITRLMALVEPVFTLIVGLLVGTVVLAMALPIFNMTNSYR